MVLFPNGLITINIIWLISKKGLLLCVKNDSSLKLSCKSSIPINLAFQWRVLLQKPSGGPSRLSQVRKGKEAVSDEFCEPTVTLMVSHPRQEATLVIRALSLSLVPTFFILSACQRYLCTEDYFLFFSETDRNGFQQKLQRPTPRGRGCVHSLVRQEPPPWTVSFCWSR